MKFNAKQAFEEELSGEIFKTPKSNDDVDIHIRHNFATVICIAAGNVTSSTQATLQSFFPEMRLQQGHPSTLYT